MVKPKERAQDIVVLGLIEALETARHILLLCGRADDLSLNMTTLENCAHQIARIVEAIRYGQNHPS